MLLDEHSKRIICRYIRHKAYIVLHTGWAKICHLTFTLLLLMLMFFFYFGFHFLSRLEDSYFLMPGLSVNIVRSSSAFQNSIPSFCFLKDVWVWKCIMWAQNRKLLPCHLWFPLPLKCILALLLIHKVKWRTIMHYCAFSWRLQQSYCSLVGVEKACSVH